MSTTTESTLRVGFRVAQTLAEGQILSVLLDDEEGGSQALGDALRQVRIAIMDALAEAGCAYELLDDYDGDKLRDRLFGENDTPGDYFMQMSTREEAGLALGLALGVRIGKGGA